MLDILAGKEQPQGKTLNDTLLFFFGSFAHFASSPTCSTAFVKSSGNSVPRKRGRDGALGGKGGEEGERRRKTKRFFLVRHALGSAQLSSADEEGGGGGCAKKERLQGQQIKEKLAQKIFFFHLLLRVKTITCNV